MAKYTILESLNDKVPLPSHFDANNFTLAAMDNFDNADRNSLSGTMHAHDTAMTLFQVKPISHPEKPQKSTFDLSNTPDLHELPCQKIIPFHATHKLPLAESIKVAKDLFVDHSFKDSFSKSEFVINATQSIATDSQEVFIPSWAGFQSLISDKKLPKMHVGFVPFLPKPVTEYYTVYTAMKNFTHLAETLNQEALPLFCDEGVFRIVIDIYLNEPDQFSTLIPMLGGFHAAKCLQHCIGKFIKGSGLEESLRQTRFFGIKIVDSVLEGSHYVRSLKGLLILANAIEKLKWEAFIKTGCVENTGAFDDDMKSLLAALETSKRKTCREKFRRCLDQSDFIHSEYEAFTKHCSNTSEIVQYLEELLKLVRILKNLIYADREGSWTGHLQAVQDMLPVFIQAGSINYARYCSLYLEIIRKLQKDYPSIYKQFCEGILLSRPRMALSMLCLQI